MDNVTKEIGCTGCPYAGHIELKECPDAYTDVSEKCGLYIHEPIGSAIQLMRDKQQSDNVKYCLDCKHSDYIADPSFHVCWCRVIDKPINIHSEANCFCNNNFEESGGK